MPIKNTTLNLPELELTLAGTPFAGHIHAYATVASTNTLAIEAAQSGSPGGVWIADEQTAGRGRGGHAWHSSAGDGLYVSVLMRPRLFGADALKISLAAGVAAVNAIDAATGEALTLRWPNDLMDKLGTKKVGGILTESAIEGANGALSYAVVGLGINLNQQTMPPGLEAIASSLRLSGCAQDTRREVLLPLLLRELLSEVTKVEQEAAGANLPYGILARFEFASPMVRGLRVHVAEDGGYTGITEGLDPHGLLRVRAEDGTLRIVRHGGVRRQG